MSRLEHYTCEEVFRLLDDYLDRELAEDEVRRVEEHLTTCAECASEYGFEGALLDGLKEKIRHIVVPQSVIEKVAEALKTAARNLPSEGGSTKPDD